MRFSFQGSSLWALVLLATLAQAQTGPERYRLDPDHATVAFLVRHIGFARVLGSFRQVSGEFEFDEKSGRIGEVRIVVRTASVDTGVEARDRHLNSADFFDVEKHPEMVFESDGAQLGDDRRAELRGRLTLRGQTRPLVLDVIWNKSALSPLVVDGEHPYVLGASASGRLKRSEFGMDYGLANLLVGDEVELLIELEARRQD